MRLGKAFDIVIIALLLSAVFLVMRCHAQHPATCLVRCVHRDGSLIQGSGVLIGHLENNESVVLTVAHNLRGCTNQIGVYFPHAFRGYAGARLAQVNHQADIAVLLVRGNSVRAIKPAALADESVPVDSPLIVEGFPSGRFSQSRARITKRATFTDATPVYWVSAPSLPGASGGPIYANWNNDWRVAGIITGSDHRTESVGPAIGPIRAWLTRWGLGPRRYRKYVEIDRGGCQVCPQPQQAAPRPQPVTTPAPIASPNSKAGTHRLLVEFKQQSVDVDEIVERVLARIPKPKQQQIDYDAIAARVPVVDQEQMIREISAAILSKIPDAIRVRIHAKDDPSQVYHDETQAIRGQSGTVLFDIPYERSGIGVPDIDYTKLADRIQTPDIDYDELVTRISTQAIVDDVIKQISIDAPWDTESADQRLSGFRVLYFTASGCRKCEQTDIMARKLKADGKSLLIITTQHEVDSIPPDLPKAFSLHDRKMHTGIEAVTRLFQNSLF